MPICEDIWTDGATTRTWSSAWPRPAREILLVPNGSPYWRDKDDVRLNVAVARVTESGLPLIYVNQVGGQDELVFDGASFALNADRSLAFQLPAFARCVVTTQWKRGGNGWRCVDGPMAPARRGRPGRLYAPACWACATMSTRTVSAASCSGFPAASIRRLCAAMAVDALGAERVRCVMLPFRYTSQALARRRRGDRARRSACTTTSCRSRARCAGSRRRSTAVFAGAPRDVTEENLQARARGTILMAISNKFGLMVVTTGNKSEMSVGYATLYGDMNGGFNPIKDLYKTEVYRLARLRNAWKPDGALGPDGPGHPREHHRHARRRAELRENQTDQDSLPPYEVLDADP